MVSGMTHCHNITILSMQILPWASLDILLNGVTRGHLYTSFIYHLMCRMLVVFGEKIIHFLDHRTNFEEFVVLSTVLFWFIFFIRDTKVIANFLIVKISLIPALFMYGPLKIHVIIA